MNDKQLQHARHKGANLVNDAILSKPPYTQTSCQIAEDHYRVGAMSESDAVDMQLI